MLRHIESMRNIKSKVANAPEAKVVRAVEAEKSSEVQQPAAPKVAPIKRPSAPVGADRTEPIKGFKRAMVKSMTTALVSCNELLFERFN